MSSYFMSIHKIFLRSDSKKVSERKEFIQDLLNIIEIDAVRNELTQNSESTSHDNRNHITWNILFQKCHQFILDETKRMGMKSSKTSTEFHGICCTLILNIIRHASTKTSAIYLNFTNLRAAAYDILESDRYKHYHDTYMKIFVDYVLSIRLYRIKMTPDHWQKLYKLCITFYENSKMKKDLLLKVLHKVVHYSYLQSQLLHDIKTIFPFLRKIIDDVTKDPVLLSKLAYKLIYTVCEQLGTECRISLCEFSESIVPQFINLEDNPEKYKLLHLFIIFHHPNGALSTDSAAYAHDWHEWKQIMINIYNNIRKDIKNGVLSRNFIELACEVCKQIIDDPCYHCDESNTLNDEQSQRIKRRRLSVTINKPSDLFTLQSFNDDIECQLIIIEILTEIIEKYPNIIKLNDLPAFMKLISDKFSETMINEEIIDSLCKLCTILIITENILSSNSLPIEATKKYWDKIWHTLVKILGLGKNQMEGHQLLQLFVEKLGVLNINTLLCLYIKNEIPWSTYSVHTLYIICNNITIPDYIGEKTMNIDDSVKICLLQWLINISTVKTITSDTVTMLCEIITNLTLETWNKKIYQCIKSITATQRNLFKSDNEFKYINDIVRCHLSLEYEIDLFSHNSQNLINENNRKHTKPLFSEAILDFTIKVLYKSIQFDEKNTDNIDRLIYNLTIVAKFMSNLFELNIESDDERLRVLQYSFNEAFTNINNLIICKNLIDRNNNNIINLIRGLSTLYEVPYHNIIADSIVSLSNRDVLLALFGVCNVINSNEPSDINDFGIKYYEDIFEFRDHYKEQSRDKRTLQYIEIPDDSVITIGTYRVLTLFGCVDSGNEISQIQTKALINFLQIEIYAPTSIGNLWQSLVFMKSLAICRKGFISSSLMTTIVTFINELFQLWNNDGNGIIGIIEIIPYFLQHMIHIGVNTTNILRIINQCYNLLRDNKFGPTVYVNFFRCLHEIIQLIPSLDTINNDIPIIEIIMTIGIKNSFYIARIEVVKIIHFIFQLDNIDRIVKKQLFIDIERILFNSFKIRSNYIGIVNKDEFNTRTSTALYILASIIHSSGLFQTKALISILELYGDNDISINSIIKIFQLIINNDNDRVKLIEINLPTLMMRWIKKSVSLKTFPWILLQVTSEEDFYKKYIGSLIQIKLETNELSDMFDICNNLECSFSKIIDDNFSLIMAWLLGQISNTINIKSQQYAMDIFTRLKYNTDEFKSLRNFNELFNERLADIIINIIKRLHDESHLLKMFDVNWSLPRMYTPNFNRSTVDKCIKLIKQCLLINDNTLIHWILINNTCIIQKILLSLSNHLYEFNMTEYKVKAFYQYAFFCNLLMDDIREIYFNNMAMFVIRDVCYTSIHIIQNENNSISLIAAKYLFEFIKGIIQWRSNEINCILNFLIKNLISIKQLNKMENIFINKILEFLMFDSSEIVMNAIRKLNVIPNHSSFNHIQNVYHSLNDNRNNDSSLHNDIEHFLNTESYNNTINCSYESLSHLKQMLYDKKCELNDIYRDIDNLRGLSDDCTSSILHRLIYRLVKLTENYDINISLMAAQCLGEIGPGDLTTMILHREKSFLSVIEHDQCELTLTYQIAVQLADFYIDNDNNLRCASSNALYKICSSYWGQQVLTNKYLNNVNDTRKHTLQQFILPFLHNKKIKKCTIKLNNDNCLNCFDKNNVIWHGDNNNSYTIWITNITCMILNCFNNYYSLCLIPICKLNTEFCEMILPKLIYMIIYSDNYLAMDVYKCINEFFNEYFNLSIKLNNIMSTIEQLNNKLFSHECVKCMLNVVNFIRIKSDHNLALKLNYLHIAKAAQYCSAYFTSVLYAELFCQIKLQQTYTADSITIIDHICELYPNDGKSLQHILREAFVQIGDPDLIHGCGLSHLKDPTSRMKHYIHVKQWDKVMISQDVELTSGYPLTSDLAEALRHSGLDYLLNRFVSTVQSDENVNKYIYETAWRLSDWSIPSNRQTLTIEHNNLFNIINNNDYDYYHYHALKCLHANDNGAMKDSIDMARVCIIKSLRNESLECSQTLYPKLLKLKMLRELEQLSIAKSDNLTDIIAQWSHNDLNNINDFTYIEPILTQRIVMCDIKYSTNNNTIMKDALINSYLILSKCAELHGYYHIAARSLALLSKQNNLPHDIMIQLQYHDALLAWRRNDHDIGRYLMHDLINKRELNDDMKARALRIYGNWMAETKSENSQCVIEKYYLKSIEIANIIINDNSNLNDTYAALAQYSDAQYQQINAYMKTPIFESLKECAEYRNNDKQIEIVKSLPREEKNALKSHKAQDTINVLEYENTQNDQKMYLILAVKNYLMTLRTGENHNFLIFRLVSLWLNNTDNIELNKQMALHMNNIPSFKFLQLIPQLAPHITNDTNTNQFKSQIYDLVKRCSENHPHHTLPILFALMNNYSDYDYNDMPNRRPKSTEREFGAKKLLNELNNGELSDIINEMNSIADALIMFAYLPFDSHHQVNNLIPLNQKIRKIKHFQYSLLSTITLDVRPSGDYNNIVSIYKYDDYYQSVGGINAPKKIVCTGTDGIERKQLIKGKDDLRQDAVMQQLFNIINLLLVTRNETKRRKLNIRTYKIIPLSQRSGVMEWCDNTLPISVILCGTKDYNGMHKKYYPNDWSTAVCKNKIMNAKRLSNGDKLKIYMECCDNLHPALQYFFMEKFSSPEIWFERRLAYVRSVATTSMVGYIIGLGDRHFSNILIDQNTAEVIHIDFGIAFEQGKILPMPETIPFRLTRDMEAAMGISGVEGVMRKSCEETMTVLRDRREIIITLLQVLLYAPLFSWTITPARAWELQSESRESSLDDTSRGEDNKNKIAERALLRIDQKLQGTEDGLVTSISGQVERLIQEARDPVNLSKLFCGWQAYL